MLDITSLGDKHRVFIMEEECAKCINNGKGADKCKVNKDGKCNFQKKPVRPECHKCAYGMEQYNEYFDSRFYVCSIGKFVGTCNSFVPYEHKEKEGESESIMPPHEFTDKERLLDFIKKYIPDAFECKHFSLSFSDDGDAFISITNHEPEDD